MSKKIYESVLTLITKEICSKKLECLSLNFFGGEPLLSFDNIVNPLINNSYLLSNKHNKKIKISFVTNAFLLSNNILDEICKYKIPITIQVTLDGNKETHNSVRTTKKHDDTYSIILSNIKEAINRKISIILRLNTTVDTINSFYDITEDLVIGKNNPFLLIDIHRIWQDKGQKDSLYDIEEDRLRLYLRKMKFNVSDKMKISNYRCYADSNNQFVVNYDGNIFRCTARDFNKQNSEGIINESGCIEWSKNYDLRNSIKYGTAFCQKCIIFPLCHGGCSQNKIEHLNNNHCYWDYTEEEKILIVQEKINSIIELKNRHDPNY